MKKFLWLFAFALTSTVFFTSCEEDTVDPGPGFDTPPSISISGISATTVEPGATITFTVTANSGTNEMNSLKVTEDGVNMSATDGSYSIDEFVAQSLTLNNPQLLTNNDRTNFTYNISIIVPATPGDYVYEAVVADDKNVEDSDSFTVTVEETGTPLSSTLVGVLLNQAGPAGQGALDLDQGFGTGVTSNGMNATPADAEIRDMGIDTDLPNAENWRQQIGAMNDATLRVVDVNAQPEGFSFANVATKEEIIAAYDTGINLPTEVNGIPASDPVSTGDLFVVERGGVYYLLSVASVDVTASDNTDSYTFDIKY